MAEPQYETTFTVGTVLKQGPGEHDYKYHPGEPPRLRMDSPQGPGWRVISTTYGGTNKIVVTWERIKPEGSNPTPMGG